ncbi:transcription elongation factor NusA [Candidatus Nanohalobium constans]|uniref:Transcription elongation factor NusA n=1 Tax=Candidatus Nanohalobium constans TaxID=2565781 RepID=A0A5Q0UH62_9ARCH|nr:transcription elongation factor NusA [Candidatus Nanohalobium constans]QGA80295.1 transcription elongation factor NusA [Candidatus Nanohalobium constans]
MKAPICNVCLKSDVLCSNCEEKLENGEINELEIQISRKLKELSDEYGSLRDSEILHVYDTENVVVIVTAEGDGAKVVGRSGEIVKKVAEEIDKSIRVVEKSENDREVIKGLLSPAEIESVNTVFTPDGEHQKIVVDEEYKGKINMSNEEFEEIIEKITGSHYLLSFE